MLWVLIFIWKKKLALYVVKNENACIRINKNTLLLQFFFFFSGLYFQKILYIRVKLSYLSCEFKRLDKETQKLEGKKAVAAQERQANRRLKEEQQQILHTKNRLNCYPNEILYFNTVLFWITNMISKILLVSPREGSCCCAELVQSRQQQQIFTEKNNAHY